MNEHIGELAELYALGTLGDSERELVDAHVQTCDTCAAELGEAEATLAATIPGRTPPAALDARVRASLYRRSDWWRRAAPLAAAAFILGLLPSAFFALERPRVADSERGVAIRAMVNSHFAHVPFSAAMPDAPKAKLVYAKGAAGWRLIIAQTTHPYAVRAVVNGRMIDAGTLHVDGDAAELFIPRSSAREFALTDGTRTVARAKLP